MANIAIILSGGVGTRMGTDIPKQYIIVNNLPILHYSLNTFLKNQRIDKIVICCSTEWRDFIAAYLKNVGNKEILYSTPGATRQLTIYNALTKLEKICNSDDFVIIHDAARPLVSHELINDCLDGCKEHDGVLPVIRMKDTVYLSEDGHNIKSLLNRDYIFAGQAPEAFRFKKYYDIHKQMAYSDLIKINGSTEIAFKFGLNITMIPGDEMNFKITTPGDLESFTTIINKKSVS